MQPHSFIFVGRSGCGKGTQADLIIKRLKQTNPETESLYISTGQELRKFIKGDSETEKRTKSVYDEGGLMPEFVAIYVWVKAIVERFSGKENIIFDGAARKPVEAHVMASLYEFYKLPKPWVVNIVISDEEAKRRMVGRGRSDDNEHDIEKRLEWYDSDVVESIKFFSTDPRFNYIEIDGERSVEDIHADIIKKTGLQ